jgi:hypothetical protein
VVGERQWPVKTKMFEFTGMASCCPTGLSSYWLMCLLRDSKWHPVTGHLNWHRVNGPSLCLTSEIFIHHFLEVSYVYICMCTSPTPERLDGYYSYPALSTESVALTTQHPLSAKVGTTSPTSGGRSIGIVRSRTKATEFTLVFRSVPSEYGHSSYKNKGPSQRSPNIQLGFSRKRT